ncbi:MAG TPA: universal stress protein [Aliidongia sp.]|nr:universal stress protein [Aliidongia sp.]
MLKDILVHVDGSDSTERRLEAATLLAERSEAHLVGLYVNSIEDTVPYRDLYAIKEVMQYIAEQNAVEQAAAEAIFRRATVGGAINAEWRVVQGLIDRTVVQHARTADLAVVGQNNPERPPIGTGANVPTMVPLSSGRPTLVVPYAGHIATIGKRVLVAWDGGREAARAVNDALPLLKTAERVTIVSVCGGTRVASGELPCADIAAHLARHDVNVDIRSEPRGDIQVADLLLSVASDLSADLLVMGAYGHSRMRELFLGGVTRAILDRMTLPVLMSH